MISIVYKNYASDHYSTFFSLNLNKRNDKKINNVNLKFINYNKLIKLAKKTEWHKINVKNNVHQTRDYFVNTITEIITNVRKKINIINVKKING